MDISYDFFTGAFLSKISEYEFIKLKEENRTAIIDDYMKRSFAAFKKNCNYDFLAVFNDETRVFNLDVEDEVKLESELDEIADIVSEGMVVQWLKPYAYKQDLLESMLNTRDFTTYSPAELLKQVGSAYAKAQRDFTQMIREYSYNHGNLTELHL